MQNHWLTVDIRGLAKLIEDKPRETLVYDLIQNAWDEQVTFVTVTLKMIGRGKAQIEVVDDNPAGFVNLTQAFTLYAESKKKGDAARRGRFNVGEKYVLALCDWAEVVTTTGHLVFEEDGTRRNGRARTTTGTRFTGHVRMTIGQLADVERAVSRLFPPAGVETTVNGVRLEPRSPIATFSAKLPTVIGDAEGVLRRSARQTEVRVYEPYSGEVPTVYEMGIPVVESYDRFHTDVLQKVPLGQDRDSLPPAFLRTLRAEVLNATHDLLRDADAKAAWIDDALTSQDVTPDAVNAIVTERFGAQRVIYDPSDIEANKRAADRGFSVVSGGAFSKEAWMHIKAADLIVPAGRQFPTPRGIGGGDGSDDAPTAVMTVVDEGQWSAEMQHVVAMMRTLLYAALGHAVSAQIVLPPIGDRCALDYSPTERRIRFNLRALGRSWFESQNLARQLDSIIHEGAHDRVADHMSEAYYRECTRIGGCVGAYISTHPGVCQMSTCAV